MPQDVQNFLVGFLPIVSVLAGVALGALFSPFGKR